jgi:DNA-binding GntR family transcriptional regulator
MAAALLAGLPEDAAKSAAEALEQETGAMEQALERGKLLEWAAADERFHQLLTERCGNRRLARMAAMVRDQSHRARLFTLHLRPLPLASAADHRRIIEAIRSGDAAAAEAATRAHRIGARDALLPLLTQYGMRNL